MKTSDLEKAFSEEAIKPEISTKQLTPVTTDIIAPAKSKLKQSPNTKAAIISSIRFKNIAPTPARARKKSGSDSDKKRGKFGIGFSRRWIHSGIVTRGERAHTSKRYSFEVGNIDAGVRRKRRLLK